MKPPAWRHDRAIYPHTFAIQTRYADEDRLGHVNNIAVAGYYDEARSRFSRYVFEKLERGALSRIVTADSRVTYLAEVFYQDELEVCSGILRIGSASYDIGQALFKQGRCLGIATTTLVQASASGASPLSESLRAALNAMMVQAPASS